MATGTGTEADEAVMSHNEIVWAFESKTCICGLKKKSREAFCQADYYGLSKERRNALWQRFNEGFQEAYLDAVAALKITPERIDRYKKGLAALFAV